MRINPYQPPGKRKFAKRVGGFLYDVVFWALAVALCLLLVIGFFAMLPP